MIRSLGVRIPIFSEEKSSAPLFSNPPEPHSFRECFFIVTLDTGLGRPLGLELSDTEVYAPWIRWWISDGPGRLLSLELSDAKVHAR